MTAEMINILSVEVSLHLCAKPPSRKMIKRHICVMRTMPIGINNEISFKLVFHKPNSETGDMITAEYQSDALSLFLKQKEIMIQRQKIMLMQKKIRMADCK